MPWKPNTQSPTIFDGEPFPNVINAPIKVIREIEVPSGWSDTTQDLVKAANGIEESHVSDIESFVSTNRSLKDNGIVNVSRRQLDLGDMLLRYDHQFGVETISMIARPTNSSSGRGATDLNYDGYIAWVNTSQYDTAFSGKIVYTFQLNGVTFYTYNSILLPNTALLFAFGQTGLRCQSLIDASKTDPDLPGNPNAKTPPGLFGSVLPSRKNVSAFTNSFGGAVDSYPDLPGYFVYDMGHPLNNAGNKNVNHAPNKVPDPKIVKLLQVPGGDTVNPSPLKLLGKNFFRVLVQPSAPFENSWSWSYAIYVEFYSRYELRKASSSWRVRGGQSASITVNDKPLYWAMQTGAYPIQALDFDLTPANIDTAQPTQFNPSTAYQVGQAGPPTLWTRGNKGLWRPGDQLPVQPQPPNGIWDLALLSAQQTFIGWCALLTRFYYLGILLVPPDAKTKSQRVGQTPGFTNSPQQTGVGPSSFSDNNKDYRIFRSFGNPGAQDPVTTKNYHVSPPTQASTDLQRIEVKIDLNSGWISDISNYLTLTKIIGLHGDQTDIYKSPFPSGTIVRSVEQVDELFGTILVSGDVITEYDAGNFVGDPAGTPHQVGIRTTTTVNTYPYAVLGQMCSVALQEMTAVYDTLQAVISNQQINSYYDASDVAVGYLQQMMTSVAKMKPMVDLFLVTPIPYVFTVKVVMNDPVHGMSTTYNDYSGNVGGLQAPSDIVDGRGFLQTTTAIDPSDPSYVYPYLYCDSFTAQTMALCALNALAVEAQAPVYYTEGVALNAAIQQYTTDIRASAS